MVKQQCHANVEVSISGCPQSILDWDDRMFHCKTNHFGGSPIYDIYGSHHVSSHVFPCLPFPEKCFAHHLHSVKCSCWAKASRHQQKRALFHTMRSPSAWLKFLGSWCWRFIHCSIEPNVLNIGATVELRTKEFYPRCCFHVLWLYMLRLYILYFFNMVMFKVLCTE